MRRRLKFCRTVLVVMFAFGVITAPAREREAQKFSSKAERRANSLSQQIRQEIGRLKGHEWAGEYYEGDGLGVNVSLLIAPEHGFVFEWHGCLGLYDRNYGCVATTNGRLQLSFAYSNKQEGFEGLATEFVPV